MENRNYNIYFHTHTISGIVICALLYVMFFAGSFSFFKNDIAAWQKNISYEANRGSVVLDLNHVLDSLSSHHKLTGRDFEFNIRHGISAYVTMSASNDSTVKAKVKKEPEQQRGGGRRGRGGDGAFFTYYFLQKKAVDYQSGYDMGEFLYRLHFLAQLNVIPIRWGSPFGYLLAGVVSFIFLFALITGLMLHWNKIVSNFFTFRPWAKWKTIWTDMHTALGVLQFPFQLMFAVTGVILIANWFLISPYTQFLYGGNPEKLNHALEYSDSSKFRYTYTPLTETFDLNAYVATVDQKEPGDEISRILIRNYNDDNMHVIVQTRPLASAGFAGSGKVVYRVRDKSTLFEKSAVTDASYIDHVKALVYHLHFGDFGGRPLRVIYFVLGLLGCVVIISGILIWLGARDKSSTPKHKRVFNFWTANVFLAACLSMLPVTAFTMIVLLFLKNPDQSDIYHWYFYSWLALAAYFILRRNLAITNRQVLLLSVITCALLPLFDGILRGNWFWNTYSRRAYDILFVDILFLCLSVVSAIAFYKIKNRPLVSASKEDREEGDNNAAEVFPSDKPIVIVRPKMRATNRTVPNVSRGG